MENTAKIARQIRKNCEKLGTYRPEFDPVILRLAELTARKEKAADLFKKSGGHLVIEQTNKSGAKYITKNPYLAEIDNTQKLMLDLEKELGLTPAALKKIRDEELAKAEDNDPIVAAINGLRVVSRTA